MNFSSLRVKLQLLIWIAIIPALLLIVFGGIWYHHQEEAKITDEVVDLVNLTKNSLDRYINDTRKLLLTISHTDVVQSGSPSSISAFFRDIHKHFPEHTNFGAVDLKGNVFASAAPLKKPVNASDMFWFQQAMESRKFTIGEYQIGRVTGVKVIVFGQPVFDRAGNMKFVLFASMDIRWLGRLWEGAKQYPDSHFIITDRNGTILFHYPDNEKWAGSNKSEMPLVKAMLIRKEGGSETECEDGIKRIFAFTGAGTPEGSIHMAIGISKKAAFKKINNILIIELIILMLVTLGGILSARMFSRRFILKPLSVLQSATERFLSGDYASRTNLKDSANEIISYADVFDKMAETIEKNITEREKVEDELRHLNDSLREAEMKFHSLAQTSSDGIILADSSGSVVFWNDGAEKIFGFTAEEIIGKQLTVLMPERYRAAHLSGIERVKDTGKSRYMGKILEYQGLRKDGMEFPLEFSVSFWPTKEGTFFMGILRDITERNKLEGQLRHAQKMEAIGTLAGGIAHDFNNLLSVIIGYGELMQMRMKPEDPQLPQLKEMLAAGERAANLAKGLLTFSRKQVMEVKTVNINEIVDGFKTMISRIIGEDIELRITLYEEDLIVKADIVQLEQVLMNLAVNARDAMPKGGVLSIRTESLNIDREFISAHSFGEPGRYALITVADTGAGMDKITRERIFEPYFTTKGLGKGTGLGLSIIYGIVKQHNGYINCYSEIGKGATFRIYLPFIEGKAEEIEAAEMPLLRGGEETILLAEDDPNVRKFLKDILEGFGYAVIEAADGEDAVKRFKENKDTINLLLFDLIMPKKSGKDAYEDIKGRKHDIKAAFISGYARDIIQKFGIEDGIEFISKPVSPSELLRKVRDVLDRGATNA